MSTLLVESASYEHDFLSSLSRPPVDSYTDLPTGRERLFLTDPPLSRGELEILGSGPLPAWFRRTVEQMEELLTFDANWDSYGAEPVSLRAVADAIEVIAIMAGLTSARIPPPVVVPTPAGGIQLEWHQNQIDLEIEVNPARNTRVFVADAVSQEELEGSLDHCLGYLQKLLVRLGSEK